jgi:hypothetical protein
MGRASDKFLWPDIRRRRHSTLRSAPDSFCTWEPGRAIVALILGREASAAERLRSGVFRGWTEAPEICRILSCPHSHKG